MGHARGIPVPEPNGMVRRQERSPWSASFDHLPLQREDRPKGSPPAMAMRCSPASQQRASACKPPSTSTGSTASWAYATPSTARPSWPITKASLHKAIIHVVLRFVPTWGLLFLRFVGPQDTRSVTLHLPTWVPDLTALGNTPARQQRSRSTAQLRRLLGRESPGLDDAFTKYCYHQR